MFRTPERRTRTTASNGKPVPAVLFYPWAWNHFKVEQHANVGGKGCKPQGQGSSEEQKRASQER